MIADTWWHAKTALDALPIEWDYGPNARSSSASLLERHLANLKEAGTVRTDVGNVDTAMARAVKVVEATYTVPYVAHACMDPGCATAIVTADRVDLWPTTQHPDRALDEAARELGMPPEKVYVHSTFLGGGYGITNGIGRDSLYRQAVAIAKTLNGGELRRFTGSLNVKPNDHLTVNFTYDRNQVALAEGSFTTELIGTKVIYGLTSRAFFNAYIQYNTDTHLVNKISRVCITEVFEKDL